MRRAPLALVLTAVSLTGLAVYRTRPVASTIPGSSLSLSASGSTPSTTTTTSGTSSASSSTPTSTSTTTTRNSTTTTSATKHQTTTTSPARTTTTSPTVTTTTTTTSSAARTATGEVVNYGYGTLSIEVTVSGKTITKVSVATLSDGGNFRSQSIDDQSIPVLEQEVLQAQSANVQSVSGASYTSRGFIQSLQNALTSLGI